MGSVKTQISTTLPVGSTEKIELLTDMLNVSIDCIKVIKTDGSLVFMNRSGCEALGVSVDETEFGMDWISLLPKTFHRKGRLALKKAANGQCSGFRGASIMPDGSVIHWDNMLTPVLDNNGKTTSILCVSRNITMQVVAEEKMKVNSETDPLTGLANRRMFNKRLKLALSKARRGTGKVGVLLIDLDNFKVINDTLGHAAGDKTLKQFTAELKRIVSKQVFISRLGGDEFAVVVENLDDAEVLHKLADQILTDIRRNIRFNHTVATFGLTIGGAVYPGHSETAEELMKYADMAMYQQKMNGKNGFLMFKGADRSAG